MKMRGRAEAYTLLCLTLGLVAAGVWTNVVGFSVNLLPAEVVSTPEPQYKDTMLWGRLFFGALIFIFARYIPRIQSSLALAAALFMSFATGILVISYHQTLIDPALFSSIGIFIARGGYTFLVALFYILFAQRMKTSHVVISITISLLLETVLARPTSIYCPPTTQIFIVMVSPIVSIGLYFIAERLSKDLTPNDLPKKATGATKNALVLQVAIFAILTALMRALSDIGSWALDRENLLGMTELLVGELIGVSLLLFLLAFLVFILPRKRFSLQMRCLFAFVVLLAGLQIIALTKDYQVFYVLDTMTIAIELFSHLALWMVIVACIRETDTSAFRIVGISRLSYAAFSIIWFYLIEAQALATSTLVMIIIYALFVAFLLLVFSGKMLESLLSQDTQQDVAKDKLSAFEQKWNLSQRESQIFELLVMGKKRSEIENEYSLSSGTIKTHISNIYRKLDVHSKGEMLELLERDEQTDDGEQSSQNTTH
jgi:DNA-binding CsgD family transcriptional regulator